ncbi:hypothetical protein PR048_022799 [Dryococelus australis]|uniref:Uncharacterized protein n=1 Tax=Dryococelus australis TaxID=614101 RepID=A0ABQ9GS98_9NEOP|nr:hypothetical protein PR048_022799 [Dryococelus australis]
MQSDDKYFNETYDAVLKHCEDSEVEVSFPKRRKVSQHLEENWQKTKKDEIRRKIYYPILDSLVQGIDERFRQETTAIVTAAVNMFKLDITKEEIAILSKNFYLSPTGSEGEIRLLKALDADKTL